MNEIVNGLLPSVLSRPYRYVKLDWNADFSMLTVRMGVRPIQCYSLAAMAELQQVFNDITANPGLVRHFVMASDVAGVFNLAVTYPSSCSLYVRTTWTRCACTLADASTSCGGGKTLRPLAYIRPHWCRATPWVVVLNPPCSITR
jgi:hypothetical protein